MVRPTTTAPGLLDMNDFLPKQRACKADFVLATVQSLNNHLSEIDPSQGRCANQADRGEQCAAA
ncbi:hypothetical protein [Thiorhodovibrio frisius]|uniref:Uncharacterized protein n=1 Tax=Thiorhodovibrio frisius TaxID=631362 RepID=H8Z2I5_9GAMM|nr:hypothetical protein [Thiorhodovibrio frisius]EIC21640.1 hypothetical protein Thi970DRAFT_01856 [Thiorhodovibrio frisius]WPL21606.1 hypothetical protein Thiofri_01732 [Thiorhodovibrio frisius]